MAAAAGGSGAGAPAAAEGAALGATGPAGGADFKRKEPLVVSDSEAVALDGFFIPPTYMDYLSHVLITHGTILNRVERLAADILADYVGCTPHMLVVLKGASEFATDLTRAMRRQHALSGRTHLPFTVDFIRVKSYEGTASTGSVTITGVDPKTLRGRDVILLEDIIDTGHTMTKLIPFLMDAAEPPRSVRVASLLEKRTTRSNGFKAHYPGFSIPDAFVVGYNMDYNEAYRDLEHLCVINKAGIDYFRAHPALASLL